MNYLVEQYGKVFFVVKKINGYKPSTIFGTEINEEEYKKLFYSNPSGRDTVHTTKGPKGSISHLRIYGDASEILGRSIYTINAANPQQKQKLHLPTLFH